MRNWRRTVSIAWLVVVSIGPLMSQAQSSQLTLPAAGPSDSMLGGNVVALPLNPLTALFHNPAQLTLLPQSLTLGALFIPFQPRYASPQGYDQTSSEVPIAPNLGYVTHR